MNTPYAAKPMRPARQSQPKTEDRIDVLYVDHAALSLGALDAACRSLGLSLTRSSLYGASLGTLLERDFAAIVLEVDGTPDTAFETLETIRGHSRGAVVPILLLVADGGSEAMVERACAFGSLDLVTRPLLGPIATARIAFLVDLYRSKKQLRRAVRRQLRQSEALALAEQAHASDERARLATDAAGLGLWLWEPTTDQVLWENNRPYEIFGIDPGVAPVGSAQFADEFVHPADVGRFRTLVSQAIEGKADIDFEGRIYRRSDRELRWVRFTGRLQPTRDGSPGAILGTVADITERKHAKEALRVGEERYRAMFDSMDEGFCFIEVLFDAQGR
ncbi:MAG: PAS domain-containing protein, partial [Caldimonas sp.]